MTANAKVHDRWHAIRRRRPVRVGAHIVRHMRYGFRGVLLRWACVRCGLRRRAKHEFLGLPCQSEDYWRDHATYKL